MAELIKKVPIPTAGVALGLAALGNLLQPYSEVARGLCGMLSLALVALLLSFLAERAMVSYHRHDEVRKQDMLVPIVFAALLIGIVSTLFNSLSPSGSL